MQSFKVADFLVLIIDNTAFRITSFNDSVFLNKTSGFIIVNYNSLFTRTIERNAGCDVRFDYDVILYEVQTSTFPHTNVKSIERLASLRLFVRVYIYLVTGVFLVKSLSRFVVFQNQLKHKNLLIIWKRQNRFYKVKNHLDIFDWRLVKQTK